MYECASLFWCLEIAKIVAVCVHNNIYIGRFIVSFCYCWGLLSICAQYNECCDTYYNKHFEYRSCSPILSGQVSAQSKLLSILQCIYEKWHLLCIQLV